MNLKFQSVKLGTQYNTAGTEDHYMWENKIYLWIPDYEVDEVTTLTILRSAIPVV